MPDLRALIEKYSTITALKELSIEESIALTDLLLLTIMVDGEITTEELEAFTTQSKKLPFDTAEAYEAVVSAHAHNVKTEIESILSKDDALKSFISARASQIDGTDKRREALKAIAIVAYSDGVDPSEEDLCHQIGLAFGFTHNEIESKLILGSLS